MDKKAPFPDGKGRLPCSTGPPPPASVHPAPTGQAPSRPLSFAASQTRSHVRMSRLTVTDFPRSASGCRFAGPRGFVAFAGAPPQAGHGRPVAPMTPAPPHCGQAPVEFMPPHRCPGSAVGAVDSSGSGISSDSGGRVKGLASRNAAIAGDKRCSSTTDGEQGTRTPAGRTGRTGQSGPAQQAQSSTCTAALPAASSSWMQSRHFPLMAARRLMTCPPDGLWRDLLPSLVSPSAAAPGDFPALAAAGRGPHSAFSACASSPAPLPLLGLARPSHRQGIRPFNRHHDGPPDVLIPRQPPRASRHRSRARPGFGSTAT